jgi:hypothetical protein
MLSPNELVVGDFISFYYKGQGYVAGLVKEVHEDRLIVHDEWDQGPLYYIDRISDLSYGDPEDI